MSLKMNNRWGWFWPFWTFMNLPKKFQPIGPWKILKNPSKSFSLLHKCEKSNNKQQTNYNISRLFTEIRFFEIFSKSSLNFPKLHVLVHLVFFLTRFGAFENFDTEHFEKFHNEMATQIYAQTNKQDRSYVEQVSLPSSPLLKTRTQYICTL